MPYKSEKIKIEKTEHDKRVKLSDEQRQEIKENKLGLSLSKLAEMYGVSKRLIQFILDPEKQKRNLELREERGGSKIYYDKEKHNESVKKHRRYKQKLFIKGKIKEE
jgi:hypothetical protein